MATYTVQIEASDETGDIWQAMASAETMDDDGTAQDVAAWVAGNQNLAEGPDWRVRVWIGADVDTGTEPAAEWLALSAEALMLDELEDIVSKVAALDKRRDELVRALMGTPVARKRIAEAAGLREPRLYQIRDGRR